MPETVAVSKLKASLSGYLERVKAGEEVIVTEHGQAIARVLPLTRGGATPAEYAEMVRAGIIRPPNVAGRLPSSYWERLVPDPEGWALRALLEEREEAPR